MVKKNQKSNKLYILIEGSARLLLEDENSPLVGPGYIINGDIVNAVTRLQIPYSVFVFEKSRFLSLELETFLYLKKKYKAKRLGGLRTILGL